MTGDPRLIQSAPIAQRLQRPMSGRCARGRDDSTKTSGKPLIDCCLPRESALVGLL
jgi:hypothetical protein